jgi:hypothetical protein
MMDQENVAAAGNTTVPAYLTLIKLGYTVDRHDGNDSKELWVAKKGTLRLVGDCPLVLLGLSLMRSERGAEWSATDDQINQFLGRFYPDVPSTS